MIRKRISLTEEQRNFLSNYFLYNDRPTIDEKYDISSELNMPYKVVQVWFQNTRAQIKKYQGKKLLLSHSYDIKSQDLEFSATCNALCIQPKKILISKYFEVNETTEKDKEWKKIPQIISRYDSNNGFYFLRYW